METGGQKKSRKRPWEIINTPSLLKGGGKIQNRRPKTLTVPREAFKSGVNGRKTTKEMG